MSKHSTGSGGFKRIRVSDLFSSHRGDGVGSEPGSDHGPLFLKQPDSIEVVDFFGKKRRFECITSPPDVEIGAPVTAKDYGRKDLIRKKIRRFIIDHEQGFLGGGGFGAVHKAYPLDNDGNVHWHAPMAVKTMKEPNGSIFEAELNARTLYQIVPLPNNTELLMPFFNGRPLKNHLRRVKETDTRKRVDIALQVAILLQKLHNYTPKGEPIIHLDLKDENILVTVDGRVFIIDFGISLTAQKKHYNLYTLSIDSKEEITKIFKEEIAHLTEEKKMTLKEEKVVVDLRRKKIAEFFNEKTLKGQPVLLKIEDKFFIYGRSENGKWALSRPLDSRVCSSPQLSFSDKPGEPQKVLGSKIPAAFFAEISAKKGHCLLPGNRYVGKRGTEGWRAPELVEEQNGVTNTSADTFSFAGLLASILGAKGVKEPRLNPMGFDDPERERTNVFSTLGMLESDSALTPRQRQAVRDYQKLMTDLDPDKRKSSANSDLTVKFLSSVNKLVQLNTMNVSGDLRLQQQIQQEQDQHEAQLILISNRMRVGSLANELVFMSVGGDIEVDKILAANEAFKNRPILFKRGEQFFVYGASPQGEWRLTQASNAEAFKRLNFQETPRTVLINWFPAVKAEISKQNGHTWSPENQLEKDFDFSTNPLFCQAVKALDKAGVFSNEASDGHNRKILGSLLSDCENGSARAEAYLISRKNSPESRSFKKFRQDNAGILSVDGSEFASRQQAKEIEAQEIAEKEYEDQSEKEAEKIKVKSQSLSTLIVKLGQAGLLTEKVVRDFSKVPRAHIEAAARIENPKMAYLYFYLINPKLVSDKDLIYAWQHSLGSVKDGKPIDNPSGEILTKTKTEMLRRVKENLEAAVGKNTRYSFFSAPITQNGARQALGCMEKLLARTLSANDFLSNADCAPARTILMSKDYRQITQPVVEVLNNLTVQAPPSPQF